MTSIVVNFEDYTPPPRFDGTPWINVLIEESSDAISWSPVETQAIVDPDPEPNNPLTRSFTTDEGSFGPGQGWYRLTWIDADGNLVTTPPVFYATTVAIYASLDDVNGNLDDVVVTATPENTRLVQISVARIIRGYLGRVIDPTIFVGWDSPDNTPEIIREVAGKLIAAQVYFNHISKSSAVIPKDHFAQRLYDEAIAILNQIITGDITIPGVVSDPVESLTTDDFWPNDPTNRAFSMGMNL